MKKRVVLCSVAAMAVVSLSADAGMKPLSDQQMQTVFGQGYTITVAGLVTDTYAVPFAHDVFAAKYPAAAADVASMVGIWAPTLPSQIASTRAVALTRANADLASTTTTLQGVPVIGPFIPNVGISTP